MTICTHSRGSLYETYVGGDDERDEKDIADVNILGICINA